MLEITLGKTVQLDQEISTESETNMDFTLAEYHDERINYHMKMMLYYLNEQKNE